MKIIESYLTNNPCYKTGKKIKVKGLMLHSVGCNQPSAKVFINSWNKESYDRACVHAFIDGNDGMVYQTLPWNHRGWHCGGSGNDSYIGIEMCEPKDIIYNEGNKFEINNLQESKECVIRTYNSAVELFSILCLQNDLYPLEKGVIVSHKEGHEMGIASNHGDPEHLWSQLGLPYSMNAFRKDVYNKMIELQKDNEPSNWAKDSVDWAVENKIINGDENGNLKLHDYVTREELCVIIKNAKKFFKC